MSEFVASEKKSGLILQRVPEYFRMINFVLHAVLFFKNNCPVFSGKDHERVVIFRNSIKKYLERYTIGIVYWRIEYGEDLWTEDGYGKILKVVIKPIDNLPQGFSFLIDAAKDFESCTSLNGVTVNIFNICFADIN